MSNNRVARGRKTARLFAEYIRHAWPFATAKGGSEPGDDIENTPGIEFEVKATRGMPLLKALKQAEKRSKGGVVLVVWRPDGYGPERVGEWVMAMRVDTGLELLTEAGYGGTGEIPG